MRLHRTYTPNTLEPGTEVELDDRAARRLGRVLRLRAGDEVVLFNGDDHDYAASIITATKSRIVVRVASASVVDNESPLRVTLAQGIARGERMDYALQKAVELGVAAIQPLFCRRTEVKLSGERLDKRVAHWRGVVVSACEQCARARVPEILPPLKLAEWLDEAPGDLRLVLRPEGVSKPADLPRSDRVTLLIGPEGGLAPAEIEEAVGAGFTPVRLGPRVLRTETAGPAALAILQALWGDLGLGK